MLLTTRPPRPRKSCHRESQSPCDFLSRLCLPAAWRSARAFARLYVYAPANICNTHYHYQPPFRRSRFRNERARHCASARLRQPPCHPGHSRAAFRARLATGQQWQWCQRWQQWRRYPPPPTVSRFLTTLVNDLKIKKKIELFIFFNFFLSFVFVWVTFFSFLLLCFARSFFLSLICVCVR